MVKTMYLNSNQARKWTRIMLNSILTERHTRFFLALNLTWLMGNEKWVGGAFLSVTLPGIVMTVPVKCCADSTGHLVLFSRPRSAT